MAKPTTRQELVDYCLRQLGAPVLEINVDDDQIDDLVDDAIQYFNERHFDGVERMYLKYQISDDDIKRASGSGTDGVGIVTTTGTANVSGIGTITSNFYENSNFIQVPDSVVGIERIFKRYNKEKRIKFQFSHNRFRRIGINCSSRYQR